MKYINIPHYVLYAFSSGINLDDYKNLDDNAVVKNAPLGKIKKLRASYNKDIIYIVDIDLEKASQETIDIAIEIMEFREKRYLMYKMQNKALAIEAGDETGEYSPYKRVDEEELKCRLSYYYVYMKVSLTLAEVKVYLANECEKDGSSKTYEDNKKLSTYIAWWEGEDRGSKLEKHKEEIEYILQYYGKDTDLNEYKDLDDQELIDRIPLGKIRELQEQLKGVDTGTKFLQLSSVSDEAIKVASEIYLYIK